MERAINYKEFNQLVHLTVGYFNLGVLVGITVPCVQLQQYSTTVVTELALPQTS